MTAPYLSPPFSWPAKRDWPPFSWPARRDWKVALGILVVVAAVVAPPGARAQQEADLVDWYYAAAFGTGVYKVDDKTVAIFGVEGTHTLLEPEGDSWGLRLLFPVTLGLYDFDLSRILEEDLSTRVGTASFLPGLEYLMPMGDDWLLKPFAQIGLGVEFSSGDRAVIYAAGVRSLRRWLVDRTEYRLGAEFKFAGYDTTADTASSLTRVGIGGEMVRPLDATLHGRRLNYGVHLIYRRYVNDFNSLVPDERDLENKGITDELEIGLSLGVDEPFEVLGVDFDQIGLAVTFGQHLRGIKLVTEFPF
jgi:hypothetical protein